YPNPFNPTTTIRYSIAESGRITLRVYNVAGQLVKVLFDEEQSPASTRAVTWDGRNQAGHAVSSGVYFYKIMAPGFTQTKKMIILK
ncbi:MAG: T9SS type A sorting domain-containing protein, partial [Candidatus Krumholzibacteria bacterium]|nr:T9SS type A sorting domain-containing protein [Candidatus Krumholzibacteria bacterium]